MPDVLSPSTKTQAKLQRGEGSVANRASSLARSLSFKYYIHDSVLTLRFQLIGDLRAAQLTELDGSWETARTTLSLRRFVLDLSQLYSIDDAGHAWLRKMQDAGAQFLPQNYMESGFHQSSTEAPARIETVRLSLLGRVLGKICPPR